MRAMAFLHGPTRPTSALRALLARPGPLLAAGAYDALSARLVEASGFDAVYLTGFGASASLLGRPDVGLLTATEMVGHVGRLAAAVRRSSAGVQVSIRSGATTRKRQGRHSPLASLRISTAALLPVLVQRSSAASTSCPRSRISLGGAQRRLGSRWSP